MRSNEVFPDPFDPWKYIIADGKIDKLKLLNKLLLLIE
jgi:hypothetical protein